MTGIQRLPEIGGKFQSGSPEETTVVPAEVPKPYRYTVSGVDSALVQRLRILAFKRGTPEGELLSAALEAYLTDQEDAVYQ